tara:strand:+ start:19221 stop:27701 length:8481 start_codon:yes stop_codon:yes gene_type:complete
MLTPEQEAQIEALYARLDSQGVDGAEIVRQGDELRKKFIMENEQLELAKEIKEKTKKVNVPTTNVEASVGTEDGASKPEPISLELYEAMLPAEKLQVKYGDRQRLARDRAQRNKKEKEDAINLKALEGYTLETNLSPSRANLILGAKEPEVLPELTWKDLKSSINEETGEYSGPDIFDPEGDDKLVKFRNIYFRKNGLNPEAFDNAESTSNANQQQLDFVKNNLYKTVSKMTTNMAGGGAFTSNVEEFVPDYFASDDEIELYPDLFNADGKVKSDKDILKVVNSLKDENKKLADITTNPYYLDVKEEVELAFVDLKNSLFEESKIIGEKAKQRQVEINDMLVQNYGAGLDDFQSIVNGFTDQSIEIQSRLDPLGISIDEINTYKPKNESEEMIIGLVVDDLNELYNRAEPLNQAATTLNSMNWLQQELNENQRVAQVIMSYGDVAKMRGEYSADGIVSTYNNMLKGFNQGEINEEFWKLQYGINDVNDPEDLAKAAERIALETAQNNGILTSRVWERYNNADTVAEQLNLLGQNPGELLSSLFLNSMAQFWETGNTAFAPIVGGGTAVGSAIPGIGTAAGFTYGMSTWQAFTGFSMEVGNAYQTVFTQAGLDLTKEEDVLKGFADEKLMALAYDKGVKRGIPIAVMNFLGGQAAGAFVSPLASTTKQIGLTLASQTLVEPIFEGAGELGAQVFAGEDVESTEIFNEMIGGQFGTTGNIGGKIVMNNIFNAAGREATSLANLETMVNKNYTLEQINTFTDRLLSKGKITEKTYKQVKENATTVDAAVNYIKNNSKGKVSNEVKQRVADLIATKKQLKKAGLANSSIAADKIKAIDAELNEITSNNALKTSDTVTTQRDYVQNQQASLSGALPFLKSLGIDSEVNVVVIEDNKNPTNLPSNMDVDSVTQAFADGTTAAFATAYVPGETQTIVVSNQNIEANGQLQLINDSFATASVSVGHEILHTVLDRSFSDKQIIDLSGKLTTYLDEQNSETGNNGKNISVGAVDRIKDRLKIYGEYKDGSFVPSKQNPKYTEAMYAQEVFTTLSDEIALGNIQWDRQDKQFWDRVANDITDYFKYKLGLSPEIINNANIQTGEQAFNFLKNFNKSFYQGRKGRGVKIGSKQNVAGKSGIRKSQQSLENISDIDKFVKNPDGTRRFNSKEDFQKSGQLFEIVNEIENTDLLDGLIRRGVNQTYLDLNPEFVRQVKERISDKTIKEFNPSKNESFFGWLTGKNRSGQSIIDLAKGDIQNKNKKNISGTSLNQDTQEGKLSMQETIAAEEDSAMSDLETQDLSPTAKKVVKEKSFAEKLNIEDTSSIVAGVINVLDPENKSLPSVTQTELRKKLEQAFKKELYSQIRPLLPRNLDDYKKFLKNNFKILFDKIPQTAINKRFTELSSVVNKRMGAKDSNIAERKVKNIYAGNTLRVKNNLTSDEFVDYFAGPNTIKIDKLRSRKNSLAEAIAIELAKDEAIDVLMDNPDLKSRWEGQQSVMNNNLMQNYVAMLAAAIDRNTPDGDIRKSSVLEASQALGISQSQLVNILNDVEINDIAIQYPTLYDTITDTFLNWTTGKFKNVGIVNVGFVQALKNKELPNNLKSYLNNKEYNWNYKYTTIDGDKRNIVKPDVQQKWLDDSFDQMAYMPVDQLKAMQTLKEDGYNQSYNWATKVHMKDSSSSRGGTPATWLYNPDGSLVSEERQKNATQEEYEEGRITTKKIYKQKFDAAINKAIKNNKSTDKTKALWKGFNVSKVQLGNKGAATQGHILDVYRNVANKPWSAATKAKVMSRALGPKGKNALEAGNQFMKAYHSSLNDWVNNKVSEGMDRAEAMESIVANMQMTTNAVYSARAYASFSSFYFKDGSQNIDKKFKGYKGEHVKDSSTVTESIVMAMLEDQYDSTIDNILSGFEQSAVPIPLANRLDKLGGQNNPLGNIRFLLDPKLGREVYNLDGVSMYDALLKQFNDRFKQELGSGVRIDPSARLIRKSQGPRKGISVWDFDDTLAQTKSNVLYTLPDGTKGKLTAEQFAKEGEIYSDKGAKFDFSEFNKVMRGKKGPMFDKALDRNKKFGNENVFILTARPQASAIAIQEFLKGVGLDIPLKNITGLEDGKPEAKANWIEGKVEEGYNDFYFADDAIKNVDAVAEALRKYDIKSRVEIAGFRNSMNNSEKFNTILEQTKGIPKSELYSDARAKQVGKKKGKFKFFIPPSAEDFVGLLYSFLSKGKKGEAQFEFFKENLIQPFGQAINALTIANNAVRNSYNEVKKSYSKAFRKSLLKESTYEGFSNQDAARVYMWTKAGYEIPGLSNVDQKRLIDVVENNNELKRFANQVYGITGEGYVKPSDNWTAINIAGDFQYGLKNVNRKEYLKTFIENKNEIFSPDNLNKIEAIYGSNFREALEDILFRMENGTNRAFGENRLVNNFMNWINNSVGAIMFFNARSAVLQTISAINFIDLKSNNPIAATAAFLNQKQYWADFSMLMNSDFLKQRRSGNKTDISAAEISQYLKNSKNKMKAAVSYLLEKGFLPTQIADSFAISIGGASFYRNKVNALIKEGLSVAEAEQQAFLEFEQITEESQQSSRPDRISQQQAGPLGRVILAFANTPMQYARLMKKATIDLVKGRGDWKSNLSKIIYYGAAQNFIFNALQQALFAMIWEEDDDEIERDKMVAISNGMADSLLRGLGVGGAAVAAIKNITLEAIRQSEKRDPNYQKAALQALSLSPPVSSKIRKLTAAGNTFKYDMDEIKQMGLSIDNPANLAMANIISAATNLPIDRVIKKYNNLKVATEDETKLWQSVALSLGWDQYSLGLLDWQKNSKSNSTKKKNKRQTTKKTLNKKTN